MSQALTLVIDQGTHATRCIVFDQRGQQVFSTHQCIDLIRRSETEIEQDAKQILASVQSCLQDIPDDIKKHIKQAALTGQRSTFLAWHKKTLQPLGMALSWQDSRSENIIKQFRDDENRIKKITGLPLSAHYGAGKIIYLQQKYVQIKQIQEYVVTPILSFLLANILAEATVLVDHSNAHRSLLFDLKKCDWSAACLQIFSINKSLLPKCCPIEYAYGELKFNNIPLNIMCGDQNAALFSHGFPMANAAYINVGTGAFILSVLDQPITNSPLLCSLIYSSKDNVIYALEATVNGAGAALTWLQQQYPVDDLYEQLEQWLFDVVQPPIFINTIGGLACPWWFSAEAIFINDNGDIAARYVAIIESIVFMLFNNLQLMSSYVLLNKIMMSGGLSNLNGLCQKMANLSALPVQRADDVEATARGAAWLAAGQPKDTWAAKEMALFKPQADDHLSQRYKIFCTEVQSLKKKQLHSGDK